MHFIAGGDPAKDLEFHVVRLRDERRFANRRVDVVQNGVLLATALISYLSGGRGLEHGIPAPEVPPRTACRRSTNCCEGYEETVPLFVECAAAHRMALHQRPGLGDARQGRAARAQPGMDEDRGCDAR